MRSADDWAESETAGALMRFISSQHATPSQEYLVVHDFVRDVQRDALEIDCERITEKGAIIGYAVSRRGIIEQSLHDPVLHRCLMVWRHGDLTFDETMALAAFELSKENRRLRDEMARYLEEQTDPLAHIQIKPQKEPS